MAHTQYTIGQKVIAHYTDGAIEGTIVEIKKSGEYPVIVLDSADGSADCFKYSDIKFLQ